jgi:hypothetical protein
LGSIKGENILKEQIETERAELITSFAQLVTKMVDARNEMPKLRDFLIDAVHQKNLNPPLIEFLTVLRFKKPIVFKTLKDACLPGTNFYQIIRLEIGLDIALERLNVSESFV